MGSIEEPKQPGVIGEYMLPIITPETSNGDPWQRNYFAPPQHLDLVKRRYPLIDIRPIISQPGKLQGSELGWGIMANLMSCISNMATLVTSVAFSPSLGQIIIFTPILL